MSTSYRQCFERILCGRRRFLNEFRCSGRGTRTAVIISYGSNYSICHYLCRLLVGYQSIVVIEDVFSGSEKCIGVGFVHLCTKM